MNRLDDNVPSAFCRAVAAVPLVSIDLVVENSAGEILLGLRENRPARHWWFVPGGRIGKGESLDAAFGRVTEVELGRPFRRSESTFLGVYEHHYTDSACGDHIGTHYVVLAHHLRANMIAEALPTDQHGRYRWCAINALPVDASVHENTRVYASALCGKDSGATQP